MGRTLPTLLVVVLAFALAAPASAGASGGGGVMLRALNAVRGKHGLRPLRHAPALARSAARYSRWQLRNDYFGHLAAIRMSHRFRLRGEVLRMKPGWRLSARRTVRFWLASPSHRSAILHPSFRRAGAGIARGRFRGHRAVMVTVHLGRR